MAVTTPRRSPPTQRHVGGRHGHVGTGSDRDAEIGLGQRGGVVDAVPDHGHASALRLQLAYLGRLLTRQHLRDNVLDSGLSSDRFGGGPVVAGQHPDLKPERPQLCYCFARLGFDGVGHRDQAEWLAGG
jgi:hypothetical protein